MRLLDLAWAGGLVLAAVVACSSTSPLGAGTEVTSAATSRGTDETTDPSSTAGGSMTAATTSADATSGEGVDLGAADGSTGIDTGPPAEGCVVDEDCHLLNDCCDCTPLDPGERPGPCPENCEQPMCDPYGIDGVECRFGTCVFKKLSCNQLGVYCLEMPPICAEGLLPEVVNGCWTGNCVPVAACDVVPDCKMCLAWWNCVEIALDMGSVFKCEPPIPECGDDPDCACAGELVCEEPADTCFDGPNGLVCTCLNC